MVSGFLRGGSIALTGSQRQTNFSFGLDEESTFSNRRGQVKKSLVKSKSKLLSLIGGQLVNTLVPGEQVLHVTTALSPVSLFERMTTGWLVHYVRRSTLVFTSQRILHFPTNFKRKSLGSISQIHYGDIDQTKGFFSLGFRYKDGSKEFFSHINFRDRKKALQLIQQFQNSSSSSEQGRRSHLCPRCSSTLTPKVWSCQSCNLQFKDRATMIRWALIFPGGSYFYCNKYFLGIGDALVEAILVFVLITNIKDPEILTSLIFGSFLVIEKLISIIHGLHYLNEFLPAEDVSLEFEKNARPPK